MLDTTLILEAIDQISVQQIEEHYTVHINEEDGKPRKYLGLSALGESCIRKVWYEWRHCCPKVFPPRLYRLFRRGHREEYVFNHLLRAVGFTIHETDEEGNQFKVSDYEGHLSGHMDGVGEAPLEFWKKVKPHPFLLEYKSYNDKRFATLQKEKVESADPKYYVQMQGYMGYEGLKGALFCAVNKNDDELYFEWVPFRQVSFDALVAKAGEIISTQEPPQKISNTPSWYECKWCDCKGICHGSDKSVKSCRTCFWASPSENKSWSCKKNGTYGTVCKHYKDIAR